MDTEASQALREVQPLGRFAGLQNYVDRSHLALEQLGGVWRASDGLVDALRRVMNLPFYRALAFTLTYCFVVTPLAMVLGFAVALGVNRMPKITKGPAIFVSILPMIITPLIGSLILFWMFNSRGILGATLQAAFDDPTLSLGTSPVLTWIVLLTYGVWTNGPFLVRHLLRGPPDRAAGHAGERHGRRREPLGSASGYVIVPHLVPLATFVALVQLMDNFRVFEPIVGFSAEANATSLSWLVYNDLVSQDTQQSSARPRATSMLTILGVVILLMPVLVRTWRELSGKAAR